MKPRTLLWTCALLAVSGTWTAWHFRCERDAMAAVQNARLVKLRDLVNKSASARKEASPTTPRATKTSEEYLAQLRESSQAEYARWEKAVAEDVSLQVLQEQFLRATNRSTFAGFFRQKRLTRDQREAFLDLVAKSMMLSSDLNAAAKAKGLKSDDSEITALRRKYDADLERDLGELIGPNPFAQTRAYDSLSSARKYVSEYGGLLSRIGQPMTHDQLDALTAVFRELDPKRANPRNLSAAQWTGFLAHARQILTPAQMEVFETAEPSSVEGPHRKHVEELLTKLAGPRGP